MKIIHQTIGVTVVTMALALTTGCDTPTGAAVGGLLGTGAGALIGHATGNTEAGALIGLAAGSLGGAIIGHLNEQQRAHLQQQSPQTWYKLQNNDAVYASSPPPSTVPAATSPAPTTPPAATSPTPPTPPAATSPTPPAATSPQMQQFTVDDIKALAAAGVKDDVVTAEIQRSNSKFSQQDIAELQQAGVSSKVIDFIKKTNAS
jgi:cytoskeletal protein RodZ